MSYDFESVRSEIEELYGSPYPIQDRESATVYLKEYHKAIKRNEGHYLDDLHPFIRLRLYDLFQILTLEGIGTLLPHRNDPKRHDRSFGQALRKKRTGSKRG